MKKWADMKINKVKIIGIIGAGVWGLVAAILLQQAGFDCEIIERGEKVGGIWTDGYHSFGLQTPKSLYEISDYPIPESYPRVPNGEELLPIGATHAGCQELFMPIGTPAFAFRGW